MRAKNRPDQPAKARQEAIADVREKLAELARRHEEQHRLMLDLNRLLDRLDGSEHDRSGLHSKLSNPAPHEQKSRRVRNRPRSYARVARKGRVYLLESREGGRQPFLVPREIYDEAAVVVGQSRSATPFADLHEKLKRRLKYEVSDYLLRTCLRFWQSSVPPMLTKTHAQYQPISLATFERDAQRAWERLPEHDGK